MNEQPQIIKKFEPVPCPHCHKEFFIGTQAMMSTVVSINTIDDINRTKRAILKRLEEVSFSSDKEKEQILGWLNKEDTILDASDIEPLVKQISVDQLEKKQNDNPKTTESN